MAAARSDRPGAVVLLRWLAAASLLPAAVAFTMVAAGFAALETPVDPAACWLAALGTLVVYGVDRLRGSEADRARFPARTRLVDAARKPLWAATVAAAIGAGALAILAPLPVQLLCAIVLAAGLAHRRLKRFVRAKPLYVAGAWIAITAGIPVLAAPGSPAVPWLLAIYASALAANLFGYNQRPTAAFVLAGAGSAIALAAPGKLAILAPIPIALLLVLVLVLAAAKSEPDPESATHLDAALALGAALALAMA